MAMKGHFDPLCIGLYLKLSLQTKKFHEGSDRMPLSSLLHVDEMYRADAGAVAAGVTSLDLMENAGIAIATAISTRWTPRPIAILCGPGNNGGDGFVLARLLAADGWPVRVALLGSTDKLNGDARANADRWSGIVTPLSLAALEDVELVVDAIFGAGLSRPIDDDLTELFAHISTSVIAVDIPSGVHGDTGTVLGAALPADLTVTFCRAKPGHFLLPGRELCGELIVADIGIPDTVINDIAGSTSRNGPALWLSDFPFPNSAAHKYTRGHAVIAGGLTMTGAARLAAKAARRMGAGLLTIATPPEAAAIYAADMPGNLVSTAPFGDILADQRKNAVLVGPGAEVGEETRARVLAARAANKPSVIDADALTVFTDDPDTLFQVIDAGCVLTPHEGEFARLFDPEGDKLTRARCAAANADAVILLKGPDTVIAAPDGRATINDTGTAYLATGGTGDVLAGMIIGLLAQGMPAFEAAAAAAWIHGRAAELFGPGLIAEDIAELIPKVLCELITDSV